MLAQRQLGQKIKDSHLKATNRDEDRLAIGAASEANAKNNSKRGDCIRWTTKGQCSDGEACAFKHDPNKKGKGKGRPRSLSSTGAPRRNSTCDGKGSDDGSAVRVVRNPSGKANRLPCTKFKTGSCQRGDSCDCWHQMYKIQVYANSNTQPHLMMKRSIQHLLHFTFHRMMNDRVSRLTRPNSE